MAELANAVASKVDTGNEAAREFIPQEILDDPAIFPAPETLALLVFTEIWAKTMRCTKMPGPG